MFFAIAFTELLHYFNILMLPLNFDLNKLLLVLTVLTSTTIPHILRMKQQREPTGPHRQNTTFPATSLALPISAQRNGYFFWKAPV